MPSHCLWMKALNSWEISDFLSWVHVQKTAVSYVKFIAQKKKCEYFTFCSWSLSNCAWLWFSLINLNNYERIHLFCTPLFLVMNERKNPFLCIFTCREKKNCNSTTCKKQWNQQSKKDHPGFIRIKTPIWKRLLDFVDFFVEIAV